MNFLAIILFRNQNYPPSPSYTSILISNYRDDFAYNSTTAKNMYAKLDVALTIAMFPQTLALDKARRPILLSLEFES